MSSLGSFKNCGVSVTLPQRLLIRCNDSPFYLLRNKENVKVHFKPHTNIVFPLGYIGRLAQNCSEYNFLIKDLLSYMIGCSGLQVGHGQKS